MRLEWLDDILAVVETGSFNEAAERRHLTQSAFSRRIRSIEDYLGVELFDRSRKPVQLRPTTEDQQEAIVRLASDLRQLVSDLRRAERRGSNRVVLASQHALTTTLTPGILEAIQRGPLDIFLRLRSANLDECFALLLSRQADVAVVYRQRGEDHPISADYIETATIGADRLIPVFGAVHAERLNARFASGELPYVAYPGDVFLGKLMERAVLPAVRRISDPTARAETALTHAALEMAACGTGVAWVPALLARERLAAGTMINLSASLPEVELDITAVRLLGTAGPIEAAVWDHLRAMAT
jgi:DNA-binding transcriptional LysR family regulator